MTDRIYYIDPECRRFEARVMASVDVAGRPAVVLDRTAFYPTSGGQPFDTGWLGTTRVVDVVDDDEERVLHVLESPLDVGSAVAGEIDWLRRFDHMQQHTGQHILSAAFERVARAATVSFHMGTEVSTIDLARQVDAGEMERAEAEANRLVWSDEPVSIRFVSADEARRLPLRKASRRAGTLRLIDIDGFDLSACGGTHVRRTGAVGVIAVLAAEKFKGGTRVTFACGDRALASHRLLRSVVAESVRVVSVTPAELPGAVERLQAELRDQRKLLKTAREELAGYQAQSLLEGAPTIGGVRLVVRTLESDASTLKAMATALTSLPGVAVAFLTSASPSQVVVARSPETSLDAGAVVRRLIERHGGKGGGTPTLAQGGGLTDDVRRLEWTLTGLLEEALGPPASTPSAS